MLLPVSLTNNSLNKTALLLPDKQTVHTVLTRRSDQQHSTLSLPVALTNNNFDLLLPNKPAVHTLLYLLPIDTVAARLPNQRLKDTTRQSSHLNKLTPPIEACQSRIRPNSFLSATVRTKYRFLTITDPPSDRLRLHQPVTNTDFLTERNSYFERFFPLISDANRQQQTPLGP